MADTKETWHFSKEISITTLLSIWAAAIGVIVSFVEINITQKEQSYQMSALSDQLKILAATMYTQKDAEKDKQIMMQKIDFVSSRVDKLERERRTK